MNALKNVLIIGGTVDARNIIERLIKHDVKITATVATEFGGSLLKKYESIDIREGRLTDDEMVELIHEIKADCLVDASHPFAENVSLNAAKACKKAAIPYLRYERPETDIADNKGIIRVRGFEEAVDKLKLFQGKIFLAIGSNKLNLFTRLPDYKSRIFARVLPDSKVLAKCEEIGLNADNIIAAKGPFSVTKDSGDAGGNMEKISAARKLGIPVIMVERPHVECEFNADSDSNADDESHMDYESYTDCRYRFDALGEIIDFIIERMKVRGE